MTSKKLTILGAGPAGMAAAYCAAQKNIPFTVIEKSDRVGGNAATYTYQDFKYDAGAHRFHDKIESATELVKGLPGINLKNVAVPSRVFINGKYMDFPPNPKSLMKNLGTGKTIASFFDMIASKIRFASPMDFETITRKRYGRPVASKFLWNYSEKLWGLTVDKLSPEISGGRLKGVGLKNFLSKNKDNLEGSFLYPDQGFGAIFEAMKKECSSGEFIFEQPANELIHNGKCIQVVKTKDEQFESEIVINTLPLSATINLLNPNAPKKIGDMARSIRFRNVVLMVFFVNKPSIMKEATLYFPDPEIPFTRITEPRNRSNAMSPEGKTSLVVEIPCDDDDMMWRFPENSIEEIKELLINKTYLLNESDIEAIEVKRLSKAYPVLETGILDKTDVLFDYLSRFENMYLLGRNSRFQYIHVHNIIDQAQKLIEKHFS